MQKLKQHRLNSTSLNKLLLAIESSTDVLFCDVYLIKEHTEQGMVSHELLKSIEPKSQLHKFLKKHKLYSIFFVNIKNSEHSVIIRSSDNKLYTYNYLKSYVKSKYNALELTLYRHITNPAIPIKNKPDDASPQNLNDIKENLNYSFPITN